MKLIMILLLTLVVSVAGFLLPGITTQIVDSVSADAVYSREFSVASPSPEPPRSQAEDSLYRLSFLEMGNMLPLAEELGTKTPEAVEALAEDIRGDLIDMGLLTDNVQFSSANLFLCMNSNDPTEYILLWKVRYGGGTKQEANNLDLMIDDETGKLLHLAQTSHKEHWDVQYRMDAFTDYYFGQLGLNKDNYFHEENAMVDPNSYMYRVYRLPAGDDRATELLFEMDIYYISISINHYRVEIDPT